ncbi:trichohyalin [Ceratina calcarata]|uniref:Trichohyalin n=1 Tax=Ceratina calcarata TaxID=156304 RepID=A0AAJ7JBQ6_9HYME|nr:trichohyalin [Ceratina calcarata]XP_017889615.1 trichohyalin [Ceratina calcarata]XP_017889616.1 trichohyalin [Ceratina calcarata]
MQPGVTVVLATVWLVVYANAVGTATHRPSRLTLDQYSPSHRHHRRHGVYGGTEEDRLGWKDRNPVEDHQVHASIPQSRSQNKLPPIHETESKEDPFKDLDFVIYRSRGYGKDVNSYFSSLSEDARQSSEFTEERANEEDDETKESSRRDLPPPAELKDPFVADDTFQDQGPGSVEIYKLDLLLLDPTPATRLPFKGKVPKKTWHWKSKEASPNILRKQSNAIPFDESRTENPAFNDPFSVGGVPELQVGCEGLEASDITSREKRSIDVPKEKGRDVDPWTGITPITLDLDYEEEEEEEMDELLNLKKLETTTVGTKRNRGDMEATLDFHRDEVDAEKLPVRGDLGKTGSGNESEAEGKSLHFNKSKRDTGSLFASRGANQRKILWLDDPEEGKRRSRDVWGFAEDEGVVSSDELQTVNQRRRLAYERRLKEEEERRRREEEWKRRETDRRSHAENRTNTDIEKIREEYERSLELRRRQDEERRRRLQQEAQPTNRWQMEEERRRLQEEQSRRNRWQDEERRRQELESRRRYDPRTYEEERKRQQQQEEEMRRREENRLREQERQRRLQEQEEARRRESDRRNLDERKREWMMKQRQAEEEKRRRQQDRNEPSNLLYPPRGGSNDTRSYDRETERRLWEQRERERQRKLNEYIERNRPINVNDSIDRRREEANRRREEDERVRRLQEERRLQEYIRRNQPVRVSKVNESDGRSVDYRREYDRSRYPGPGSGRRNHGPSAPTNIDPWTADAGRREAARRIEEERIRERQRKEQEDLRREALRREEEQRWMQSRRYEEQRKRQQAERLAREEREKAARRSQLGGSTENTRVGDRRRFPEPGRRQDTSLIPANLVSNESRRAAERQRQEMERRRLEAERQRQEQQTRAKEARQNEQRASHLKELWRRQEEARLNALPVSARIIVKPSSVPNVIPRMGGDLDIDFPGASPHRPGMPVPNFPSPPTRHVQGPPPCVWAVVHCCTSVTNNRLVFCFETLGCPGVNWDRNPCRGSIVNAARDEVRKFYAENDEMDSRSRFH